MAASGSIQAANALITEHLQYTPLTLVDEIIDTVNAIMYRGVTELENGMFAMDPARLGFKVSAESTDHSDPEYPEAKQGIEEGLHKFETLLEAAVDKNFDKFEIYVLRSILSVPEDLARWVRLSHYENLPTQPTGTSTTPEAVQMLRRKVSAAQTVSRALDKEYERNEAVLAQLRSITETKSSQTTQQAHLPNLSFLSTSNTGSGQQPLTAQTNFAMSQLPALRSIVAELRPKLAQLHASKFTNNSAKDERREDRRDYIEQRTRAHLEKHGLHNGDDAMSLTGRNIDLDKIDALEKVAARFTSLPPR